MILVRPGLAKTDPWPPCPAARRGRGASEPPVQWHVQRLGPLAQRRVVRDGEIKPEQCDD
jgi:hypothetical protein